jgi:hypothetical protein
MVRRFAASLLCTAGMLALLVPTACSSTKNDGASPTTSGAGADDTANDDAGACANDAFTGLQTDTTGATLEAAYKAHQPTNDEIKYTAFMWAVAVSAYANVGLSDDLTSAITTAAADPSQAALFGGSVPSQYAGVFPACGTSAKSEDIISHPFKCTDDCKISLGDLLTYYGVGDNILSALAQEFGGAAAAIIAQAKASSMTNLSTVVAQNVDETGAYAFTQNVGDAIVQSLNVTSAAAALGGGEAVAALLAALSAYVALPFVVAKTNALAKLINDCNAFKNTMCMSACVPIGKPATLAVDCCAGALQAASDYTLPGKASTCCVSLGRPCTNDAECCWSSAFVTGACVYGDPDPSCIPPNGKPCGRVVQFAQCVGGQCMSDTTSGTCGSSCSQFGC